MCVTKTFRLQENASEELMCFQRALSELIAATDAIYAKQFEEFYIGLEGRWVQLVSSVCPIDRRIVLTVSVDFIYRHARSIRRTSAKLFASKAS